jgi:hypothetical protein
VSGGKKEALPYLKFNISRTYLCALLKNTQAIFTKMVSKYAISGTLLVNPNRTSRINQANVN